VVESCVGGLISLDGGNLLKDRFVKLWVRDLAGGWDGDGCFERDLGCGCVREFDLTSSASCESENEKRSVVLAFRCR
jgi:hypothetical protein